MTDEEKKTDEQDPDVVKIENYEPSLIYGWNPCKAVCARCQKPTGKTIHLGKVYRWQCLKCGAQTVSQSSGNCNSCGNDSFLEWRNLGEADGSKLGIPFGMCPECDTTQKEIDGEIDKGAVGWKCVKCGSSGVLKKTNPVAKAFRKKYTVEQMRGMMVRPDKCPVCRQNATREQLTKGVRKPINAAQTRFGRPETKGH